LKFPPPSNDHASHIVYLTLTGHTKLAADHILHPEMKNHLVETIGNVIRQLSLVYTEALLDEDSEKCIIINYRIYETLLNLTLNLIGFETRIVGFSDAEIYNSISSLSNALSDLETLERSGVFGGEQTEPHLARAAVESVLTEMRTVMKGVYRAPGSMVAHTADEIEKNLGNENILNTCLQLTKQQIQENIYYKLSASGTCKFGNDYALGLRWLRHLGFVQVSTNPSLAAIAYDDDPTQWVGYKGEDLCSDFKTITKQHPELLKNTVALGDELTTYATEVSIWRNLAVFRPIAIASKMSHGMVSLQLNPNIADNYEESVRGALKFYSDAEQFLTKYDAYLLWGYSGYLERKRPNIVFKVAGSSPASIDITRKLESLGIGTNNTVTFTVTQEVELILAKFEGRAEAVKKGILLTTSYETNRGGRLDDHLREVQVEALIVRAIEKTDGKEEALKELAEGLGAWAEASTKKSIAEKITIISGRKYLRPINKPALISFLKDHNLSSSTEEQVKAFLELLEGDISYCGILVTKRVYEIFFAAENKTKWIAFLEWRYGLTLNQAEEVMRGIDILPASKRHPRETLLTLAKENMTHTEFPNHQTMVATASSKPSFEVNDYDESVLSSVAPEILERLTGDTSDIKKVMEESYEVSIHQSEILRDAKIANLERYGTKGLLPYQWGNFGANIKTMGEFSSSYETFKNKCIDFVKGISED
jgi:hypothetical protein